MARPRTRNPDLTWGKKGTEQYRLTNLEDSRRRRQDPAYRALLVERNKAYRLAHPERVSEYSRRSKLKTYFGLTEEDIEQRVAAQGGCAICGKKESGKRRWSVDHDHACCPGRKTCGDCVRGIVCGNCNLGLGNFQDSTAILKKAIAYLNQHRRVAA